MMKAKLAKRSTPDPQNAWWLQLSDGADPEIFQLPAAIESGGIFNKAIEAEAEGLVIDLSAVQEFDSRGVQVLVMLYKQFSEEGLRLVLRNPSPYLSRVLRIMQLDRVFEVESDKTE